MGDPESCCFRAKNVVNPAIIRFSVCATIAGGKDRKSTRLNSSHTEIYTLSLHDALPISLNSNGRSGILLFSRQKRGEPGDNPVFGLRDNRGRERSEEHTSELQSHRDLHSFPTRRSSDLLEFEWAIRNPAVFAPKTW